MSAAYHRNLLKLNQVNDFRTWLAISGFEARDGKGEFQLLQVKTAPDCWATINRNAQDVVSTHPDLKPLIHNFLMNDLAKNPRNQKGESAFKNFHRSLCERFGATHDPVDWWRDTVSLEEYIASLIAKPAPAPMAPFLEDLRDDIAMHALQGTLANQNILTKISTTTPALAAREAYRFADAMLEARKVRT